jgi:hypothetical protein
MRATTVYELLKDYPWYLATLVIVAMAFIARPRSRASSPS